MLPFLACSRNDSCIFIHQPSREAGVTVAGAWLSAGHSAGKEAQEPQFQTTPVARKAYSAFAWWVPVEGVDGGGNRPLSRFDRWCFILRPRRADSIWQSWR